MMPRRGHEASKHAPGEPAPARFPFNLETRAAVSLETVGASGILAHPMRISRVLQVAAVTAVALLGGAGCKGSCRQLAEKLCECEPNTSDRESCLQRVSQRSSAVTVDANDEAVCETLIEGCDCNTIDTEEGKKACGLAR